jgi:hypothetical protein
VVKHEIYLQDIFCLPRAAGARAHSPKQRDAAPKSGILAFQKKEELYIPNYSNGGGRYGLNDIQRVNEKGTADKKFCGKHKE